MNGKVALDTTVLKGLRKGQGLSQEALAVACEQRRLRVSLATIKRAETGKSVNYRTARELALFFDVDVNRLLSESRFTLPPPPVPGPGDKPQGPEKTVLTALWLRLDRREKLRDIMTLLQRRGSLWQEQLGSTLLATFGNSGQGGQGHLHAQRVMLEIRAKLAAEADGPAQFHALLQLAHHHQVLGKTELSPQSLRWFADRASLVPLDSILVGDSLRNLSTSSFRYTAHAAADEPLWLLNNSLGIDQVLPLVGRSTALLQLNAILDDVSRQGRPAMAHIEGPAGIGKSRLLAAVHEQARLREMLIADVDLETGWSDPMETLTGGLCRRLVEALGSQRSADHWSAFFHDGEQSVAEKLVFLRLLGIDPPDDHTQWLAATPDQQRLVAVMANLFSRVIEQRGRSVLLSIDNIHLATAAGCRLLSELLRQCANLPLVCVVTSRTEANMAGTVQRLMADGLSLTTISLGPLPPTDVETLCREFKDLDPEYKRHCARLAEGVPLYLLQLLSNQAPRASELPSSLQLVVEQKLEFLGDEDLRVVELLSVCDAPLPLGFVAELLQMDAYVPEQLVVAQLVKIDLNQSVKLCHQLVQQVVYQRLDEHKRRMYHGALAQYLESRREAFQCINPRSLARHFECAGSHFKAARYLFEGAALLLQKGLYPEAQRGLDRALELSDCAQKPDAEDLEINILLALSSVYKVRYGWVSPLLKGTYQRVVALCERAGPRRHLAMALFGLWAIELVTLNFSGAEELARRCLKVSRELGDEQGTMQANVALSNTLFWLGRQGPAERAAATALDLHRPEYTADSVQLLGQDPRALAGCFGALAASLLGKREDAERYRNDMLRTARALKHDFSLAIALQGSAWLDYHYHDPAGALSQAQELEALATEKGFPFYRGISQLFIGWARHKLYRDPEAESVVGTGYHQWVASGGDKIAHSLYSCILGEILRDTGATENAKALLRRSIRFAHDHSENCYLSELYRLLADCEEGPAREDCLKKAFEHAISMPLFLARLGQPRPEALPG